MKTLLYFLIAIPWPMLIGYLLGGIKAKRIISMVMICYVVSFLAAFIAVALEGITRGFSVT